MKTSLDKINLRYCHEEHIFNEPEHTVGNCERGGLRYHYICYNKIKLNPNIYVIILYRLDTQICVILLIKIC